MSQIPPLDGIVGGGHELHEAVAATMGVHPDALGCFAAIVEVGGPDGGWDVLTCCGFLREHLIPLLRSMADQIEAKARAAGN